MNQRQLSCWTALSHPRLYFLGFNHLLDRQIVPYTVNETMLAGFRATLCQSGNPSHPCHWLLMARLAEMTLLCAGHYAAGGEITAAGDLLVNPRRTDIYLNGKSQPLRKNRHGRLSDQLAREKPAASEFIGWISQNAAVRVVEPALLPDFQRRLVKSGFLRVRYLDGFEKRMREVADAMREWMVTHGRHWGAASRSAPNRRPPERAVRQSRASRDHAFHYHCLGREVVRICNDASFPSAYLASNRCPDRRNSDETNGTVSLPRLVTA
jgi:hypothetical protein